MLRRALVLANTQVATDLLLLTLLLHFTGGVENPMAAFYLFHMAIGSLVLERQQAVLQGVWAVALYGLTALATLNGHLPHYDFIPGLAGAQLYAQPACVFVAIGVLACAVFGMLYFTLHIARELDLHEQALRESNAALERSQAALKELQARRAKFMQTAAHQLKSPLATIETLAGLIRDRVVPDAAVRPTCEKIAVRCEEGIRQVSELLALARVEEADPARHALEGTDVVQTITDLCRRYMPQAHRQHLTLHFRVPRAGRLLARVNSRDLADCLDNLVSNAVKYTPAGGAVTIGITGGPTGAEACDAGTRDDPPDVSGADAAPDTGGARDWDGAGHLAVYVRDTGIGIEPEVLPHAAGDSFQGTIFEDFRRGKTALTAGIPGTGLGLAVVREVVKQAGGEIRVQSAPGQGSTFVVAFPAWQPPPT
jgi:signal transduction histidine kinase